MNGFHLITRGALALSVAGLVLATGVLSPKSSANVSAAETQPRILSVSAIGKVSGKPDIATIYVGVEASEPSAQRAMAVLGEKMTAVVDGIKVLGISGDDIQTANLNLYPYREVIKDREEIRGPSAVDSSQATAEPTVITGYRASSNVVVTIRNFDHLVWVIDSAVSSGANLLSGVRFSMSDSESKNNAALRLAVTNARAKADLLAAESGVTIVGVQSIQERTYYSETSYAFAAAPAAPARSARPVPVEPGQLEIGARVSIQYLIQ